MHPLASERIRMRPNASERVWTLPETFKNADCCVSSGWWGKRLAHHPDAPDDDIFFRNFERPFTPRTKLGSAWNFGKTRFGRFATFHFSTPKLFFDKNFAKKVRNQRFFQKSDVLEELWIFYPRWQVRREKLLPQLPLFGGRLPWRRAKSVTTCFLAWFWT